MSDEMFQYETVDDTLVVTPQGDLFQYRYEELRNSYNDIYRMISGEDIKNLVIDFAAVDHFGSAFIGMLIKLAQKVRLGGGDAILCSLKPEMTEVLESLMLLENVKTDFFWSSFPDRPAALSHLSGQAAE